MKMNNYWGTYKNAPVNWHIELPPKLWRRWQEVRAFADTVLELGRRAEVLSVEKVPPRSAFELFGGVAPTARVSVVGAAGIEERRVRDLGAELLTLRPALSHVPHVPALSVSGPQSVDRAFPVYITISLPSDIWFPRVMGLNDDDDDHSFYDNSRLAERHTPRLNRFLAGVRDAVDALGGEWSYEVNNRGYEDQVAEAAITLDQTITAERLAAWGERICTASTTDAVEMLRELGIPGRIESRFNTPAIEPPPTGTLDLKSIERDGAFARLDMQLADPTLTHADLEARFGRGVGGPRLHWDSYFWLNYRLDVPGAQYGCRIFVDFAEQPAGDTLASGVSLRRQPPQPA